MISIIIYTLAVLGIVFILFIVYLFFIGKRSLEKIRKEPREFKDHVELMRFIRDVFECKLREGVPLYGFVESADYNDGSITMSEPSIDLQVFLLISDKKNPHEKVYAPCGDINANFKKGDFVAVMPFYNKRHNLWYYVTIAKLEPYYLGEKGFLIYEQYVY